MRVPDRVLVTGGAGFIGSHVAAYFADLGASVTVLDNLGRDDLLGSSSSAGLSNFNWNYLEETYPGIELVQGDIRDNSLIERLVEETDAIVHAAGQVAVTSSLSDPRTDFQVNAGGTFNVLEAARKAEGNPPVVIASTNKVYGDNVNEIPVREGQTRYSYDDDRYVGGVPETFSVDGCEHTPYGVSKLTADLYAQDYSERDIVDAAAFRMSCIYGPRQFGNEDQGWVAHFTLSSLRGEPITIFGNGKQVRDVLFVDDLVRAYHAFLADPKDKPAVFNIGGGPQHTTSLVELLESLEDELDTEIDVFFEDWREGDQRVYVSDISRANEALSWEPETSFKAGIRAFIDWYHDQEL